MNITFKNILAAVAMLGLVLGPVSVLARESESGDDRGSHSEIEIHKSGETPELFLRGDVRTSNSGPGNAESRAAISARMDATFCEMVKDKSVDDFKKMGERAGMMDDKRDNRDGIIAGLRLKMDDKRDDSRADHEQKWDSLIAKWEANAKTDIEKAAILEFKTQLHAAVGDRTASVDGTVSGSRDDKDALRTETRAKIDAALETLRVKMTAALDRAQADCAKNVSSATVRTNFAADAKVAVDAFKASVADIRAEAKTDVTVIHDDRKSDMMSARTDFKNFFESLRIRFESLFKIRAKTDANVEVQ